MSSAPGDGAADFDGDREEGAGDAGPPLRAAVAEALAAEVERWQRSACPRCGQRAMFYCPFCLSALGVPEGVELPRPRLPFMQCDIVFDDAAKKATGVHAKVLAPAQVRLIDLFTSDDCANRTISRHDSAGGPTETGDDGGKAATIRQIPAYDPKAAVVLFPDDGSVPLSEVPGSVEFGPTESLTLIVIDAPWRRAQVLRKHPHLAPLRSVRLSKPPASRFWRYHAEGPGCVSTIEALAAAVAELEEAGARGSAGEVAGGAAGAAEEQPLLFFFARQLAHIAARSAPGAELPTEEAAKERRSARVRQKERAKRLRPLGTAADADCA